MVIVKIYGSRPMNTIRFQCHSSHFLRGGMVVFTLLAMLGHLWTYQQFILAGACIPRVRFCLQINWFVNALIGWESPTWMNKSMPRRQNWFFTLHRMWQRLAKLIIDFKPWMWFVLPIVKAFLLFALIHYLRQSEDHRIYRRSHFLSDQRCNRQ